MRRILAALIALVLGAAAANAVPATKQIIKYRQSDGSIISLRLHGDENYHYITSGEKVVALGEDGMFHPSAKPRYDSEKIMQRRARLEQSHKRARSSRRAADPLSIGEKHFLVLLIEFSDLRFTVPDAQAAFSAMLNEPGYSANGGTGSAADYYKDNSNNKFRPVFDVYGPVMVSGGYAVYGANDPETDYDVAPDKLLVEACKKLDPDVDFSTYDHDNDGMIDNIFFYYAGHNEAEGAGANYIWPHASGVYEPSLLLDGVRPSSYACTSEYRGRNGESMAGIGTFCHEFGHVIGLPDYYDVDYEDNGTAENLYAFSLMADGAYNNNGRTPPYLCAISRWLLGWIDDLKMIGGSGSYSLGPVQSDQCLSTPTSVDNEFFVYEVRTGEGWDSYIRATSASLPPQGMLIYHVDMSDNLVANGYSAYQLWGRNELNNYKAHPCYYIVRPVKSYGDYNDMLWPGRTGTTSFEGVEWSGAGTGFKLSDIAYADGKATFNLTLPTSRTIHGRVADSSDRPMENVQVSALGETAYTDVTGNYSLEFPLDAPEYIDLVFTKEFYRTREKSVRLVTSEAVVDVVMLNFSESESYNLGKHDEASGMLGFQDGVKWSYTLGVRFTAAELEKYVGKMFQNINFMIGGSSAERVDVFVDFGSTRVLTKEVPSFNNQKMTTVDVSDALLTIPEGTDVIFGVAVKGVNSQYSILVDNLEAVEGGGLVLGNYTTQGSADWADLEYNAIIDCDVTDKATPFDAVGIFNIANPGNGKAFELGTELHLSLEGAGFGDFPKSTVWYFDGAPLGSSSVTLSAAGKHTVKAVLSYSDGSTEEIEQVILVQ